MASRKLEPHDHGGLSEGGDVAPEVPELGEGAPDDALEVGRGGARAGATDVRGAVGAEGCDAGVRGSQLTGSGCVGVVVCVGYLRVPIVLAGALDPYAIDAMQFQVDQIKRIDVAPPTPPP